MSKDIYRELLEVMKKRGVLYAGMDIPEFFKMVEELFTPEQAEVNNIMPEQPVTAKEIAEISGRDQADVEEILESMANNGLCRAYRQKEEVKYQAVPFMPGIFEYSLARGTTTERDKKIAGLIDSYKKAYDAIEPRASIKITYPSTRVITVDRTIEPGDTIHTYDQVQTYIDKSDSIAVATCYCRHEAKLVGEDTHGMPMQVCLSFGQGAEFVAERLGGRRLTKEEARGILEQCEEIGLVHMSRNITDNIDFLCNCDRWHCGAVKNALAQPKPGLFFNSGFEPRFDPDVCNACETCIDRCPASALEMSDDELPLVNLDRCFGCAVCATGCPSEAITMVSKTDFPEPPPDMETLREAMEASRT